MKLATFVTAVLLAAPAYAQNYTFSYGLDPAQKMDFYLPAPGTKGPYPIAVYFHGGSFISGTRKNIYPGVKERFLSMGWAVVSVDYPLNAGGPTKAVLPAPYKNGQRAIQQIRNYSKYYNLNMNGNDIVVIGGSAGASIAQYVAFAPDAAVLNSPFRSLQISSRVDGVIALRAQTFYSPSEIYQRFGKVGIPNWIVWALGETSLEAARAPEKQEKYRALAPIYHRSADDPPALYVYLSTEGDGDYIHDPRMAFGLLREPFLEKIEISYSPAVDLDLVEHFARRAVSDAD